jgi:hypothetical protein
MIRAGDKALAFAAVIKIYLPPDEHAYFVSDLYFVQVRTKCFFCGYWVKFCVFRAFRSQSIGTMGPA